MRGTPWQSWEIARIAKLAATGAKDKEIAENLPGRSKASVTAKRFQLGIKCGRKGKWTPEQNETAREMFRKGYHLGEIGEAIGRDINSMRAWVKRAKPPKRITVSLYGPYDTEECLLALDLFRNGESIRNLTKILEMPRSRVRYCILCGTRIEQNQKGE